MCLKISKFLILLTGISLTNSVESKSACYQYKYKPYENRSYLLSYLQDSNKIGHLSLTGTHDSMVYDTDNLVIKTQELNISQQLISGVRVIDISLLVNFDNDNTLDTSVSEEISFTIARTNNSLDFLFSELNKFLIENPREFIFLYISDLENGFYDDFFVKLDLCETLNKYKTKNNGSDRWVGRWRFNDTLGMHRGKILFATNLYSFDKCARVLRDECQFLKTRNLKEKHLTMVPRNVKLQIDHLWYKHIIMLSMDEYKGSACYIYNFHQSSTIFPRGIAKYGGKIFKCFEPINHRLGSGFPGTQSNALNFLMVDFVTQEVINNNHFGNEHHYCFLD